jgi:uncharacterized repeat protein (TIGR03803 family)
MSKYRVAICVLLALIAFLATTTHAQTFSVLYNFGSAPGDARVPVQPGTIAQGRDGNFYSTSAHGGNYNMGSVFNLTPSGQITLLYGFGGTFINNEGSFPSSGLTPASDGSFYGAAYTGGAYSVGTIFKITPSGTLTQLYDFTGGADGASPLAAPIQGSDGNLYGTAAAGGANHGVIYKITAAGKFSVLHTFAGSDGGFPQSQLIQGTDGTFYGTTSGGGANGNLGTIFKITPTGKLTTLFSFDSVRGTSPDASLIQGKDGNFYGSARFGGLYDHGVIFKMNSTGRLTVLHNFCPVAGCADGSSPNTALVQGSDGNFYGVASDGGNSYGTLFKMTPAGTFTVLHTFDPTTGWTPITLTQPTNGILYGEATGGGTGTGCWPSSGCGTFFSLNLGLPPYVTFLRQTSSGKVGSSVGIYGQGFNAASSVLFGSASASFTVSTDGYLTATVPSGATTGPITVTTVTATLKTPRTFRVLPQITSFTPSSGPVGTSVQITGISLTQANRVTFGGVAATAFTVTSDTEVTATVPTGAKTGKIIILTPGGTAISTATFTVTPLASTLPIAAAQ